ncbi:hypothetical protein Pelo_12795 [Pelomyxa schiedti]|nr:hypothetical protein Pelo_12795 [Pelomyxa schiedti]
MKLKDKSYFSRSNQDKMFETLGRVITSVSPSEIIILGDVFHSVSQKEADPVWCLSIIEKFLSFGLHATIIGGNHDRWMFEKWGDQWQKKHPKHLKVVREKLMLAQDRAETHKFYFTHDGGTALWLSPLQEVPFVLGQRAAQGLQAGDCLCTGHVHRTHDMMEAHGCASLGSCTGSGSSFHYAVFTEAQQEPASLEPGSAGRATPQQGLLTIKFYTA